MLVEIEKVEEEKQVKMALEARIQNQVVLVYWI